MSNMDKLMKKMPKSLEELKCNTAYTIQDLKKKSLNIKNDVPKQGVYAFYKDRKDKKSMYVGRSNQLRERILQYGVSAKPIGFVRKLTEDIIRVKKNISNPSGMKCEELMRCYREEFNEAKHCISGMYVRFIEIIEPKEQALFEVYASIALGSRCNRFETH